MNETQIQITRVFRKRKSILIRYSVGESHFEIDERDNPLPSFDEALEAVRPIAAKILHLPDEWLTKETSRIIGAKFSAIGGVDAVAILARRAFDDAQKDFVIETPPRLLANPSEPGNYSPPLSPEVSAVVANMQNEAKLYLLGKRAQGQIEFKVGDDDDDAGDDGQSKLEMP